MVVVCSTVLYCNTIFVFPDTVGARFDWKHGFLECWDFSCRYKDTEAHQNDVCRCRRPPLWRRAFWAQGSDDPRCLPTFSLQRLAANFFFFEMKIAKRTSRVCQSGIRDTLSEIGKEPTIEAVPYTAELKLHGPPTGGWLKVT
jgi:hypothetical protein